MISNNSGMRIDKLTEGAEGVRPAELFDMIEWSLSPRRSTIGMKVKLEIRRHNSGNADKGYGAKAYEDICWRSMLQGPMNSHVSLWCKACSCTEASSMRKHACAQRLEIPTDQCAMPTNFHGNLPQ